MSHIAARIFVSISISSVVDGISGNVEKQSRVFELFRNVLKEAASKQGL